MLRPTVGSADDSNEGRPPSTSEATSGSEHGKKPAHKPPAAARPRRRWIRRVLWVVRIVGRQLLAVEVVHFISDRTVKSRLGPQNRFGIESNDDEDDEEQDEEEAVAGLLVDYINGEPSAHSSNSASPSQARRSNSGVAGGEGDL